MTRRRLLLARFQCQGRYVAETFKIHVEENYAVVET